ncbi:fibronectin type III domain-containing protein 11-like [Pelobates fuscus]|uniref:fibronectin type III domain-containing protein 11-like n=1 Tax=Pelobates fuscus TaxID=191477 RepID=UPI002FE49B0E
MTFGEEPVDETWQTAQERKNLVVGFLSNELSESSIKRHQTKVDLLHKRAFYIEIFPYLLPVGDQNHLLMPISVLQHIDPLRFRRVKELGNSQAKILLILLTEYLEQLQKGRSFLLEVMKSYDLNSYLSKWEEVTEKLTELTSLLDSFLSLQTPCRLHVKHLLVPHYGPTKIPSVQVILKSKAPVVFDRFESVAYENWAFLKWHALTKQSTAEKYELCFKLLEKRTQQERAHTALISVTTNFFEIHQLLPDRFYEFSVHWAKTPTLVYEAWHDSITLRTSVSHKTTRRE